MFGNTIFIILLMLSPLITGDLTTVDTHIQTNTNNPDEEALTDSTLSFGIKSFTIEVTKPTTKPLNSSKSKLSEEINNDDNNNNNNNNDNINNKNLDKYEATQQSNSNYLSTTMATTISTSDEHFHHTTDSLVQTSSTETIQTTFMPSSTILASSSSLQMTTNNNNNNNNNNDDENRTATLHNATEMRTDSEIEQESTDERPPVFSSISPIYTSTVINSSQDVTTISSGSMTTLPPTTTNEPMINDIHVEKKLENGLYRIKLAEIITDEFNGINNGDSGGSIGIGNSNNNNNDGGDEIQSHPVSISNDNNQNFHHQTQRPKNVGKINIIDLYPSKLEDFGPIIRESNKKIIHDKQTILNNVDDENVLSNSLSDFFEAEKNIPTSNIEIELIDSGLESNNNNNNQKSTENLEKITDLTGKLQEQDGVITEIEKKFRLDDLKSSSSSSPPLTTASSLSNKDDVTQKSLSVNQKIEFIDRRVKKSFDFPQNQYGRFSRVDFANTKFNTEPVKKDEKDSHFRQSDKPEFSTTKFYNSKELYNEMLHRKINSENIIKKLTTSYILLTSTPPTDNGKNETKKTDAKEPQAKQKSTSDSLTSIPIHIFSAKASSSATNTNLTQELEKISYTTPRTILQPKITSSSSLSSSTSMKSSMKTKQNSTRTASATKRYSNGKTVSKDEITYDITSVLSSSVEPVLVETLGKNKKSTNTNNNNSEQEVIQQNSKVKTLKFTNADGSMSTTQKITATTASEMPIAENSAITTTAVITENVNPTLHSTTLKVDDEENNDSISNGGGSVGSVGVNTTPRIKKPFSRPRVLTRLQEKINSLECDIQNLPQDSHLWRGNETHELLLPITTPADCKTNEDCSPMIISWEGQAEIQSGDVLLVEINDSLLTPTDYNQTQNNVTHKAATTVYQVTRLGHEHCDVTEGGLLDITPLVVDGKKIVTLYDKDLTEGINLLIVVSESWGSQCVRLKVTVKSDNCGENADCSGKGVCFSNASMEGYECQCCQGFAGPHCEEIDACLPSPCTNNGICVDLSQGHEGNAYQCLCPYGYTGKNCQYESDPCNPAECLNGGSCVGNSTHFRCDCAPGYTGPLCQHNLNECESSPCVHGICVDQEDGFRCFCQPGFAGELCNFEYNECESNPCMNGGQCIDQIGGYECKCTRGYTGNQCHVKVDFCANGPCPEGHRCIDRGDDFTCECPSGTNGPDCIQVPRTLCNVNPCSNGGTCWTSEDSFYCACRPGYTGKMCEDEFIVETVVSSSEFMVDDANARTGGSYNDKTFGVSISKSPIELHNAYIAAGTLATAIFIVAVVVTICHCKVNQTYRRFSTRHHQLIPIFGFGRRMKSPKSHRHWLSGKGGGGGGGNNGGGGGGGSTSNLVGIKSNKGHLPGTGTTQCHNHPSYHHSHQLPDRPFQRHLAMNLENDMYYTVDFSDSQHSPLIK